MIKEKKSKNKVIIATIIIAIIAAVICGILFFSIVNRQERNQNTKLIINYTDVTNFLKADIFMDENEIVYLSKEDIANFYDEFIYYDEKYNQIITTSNDKIMIIKLNSDEKEINGVETKLKNKVIKKDKKYFIPFSELEEIYNVKVNYIKETNTIVIDSLDRKLTVAESKKKNNLKNNYSIFSKTVEKISEGEKLAIVPLTDEQRKNIPETWIKVRTEKGNLGYVKKDSINEEIVIREAEEKTKQIEGKISLVWDYFSEYSTAPNRTGTKIEGINVVSPSFFYLEKLGKGNLLENVDNSGKKYISWAHSNGYKVWPIVSNNSMQETTSEIMNDYELRKKLINQILEYVKKYNLDGVNINFENMKEEDKSLFSRFLIELTPRMKEIGKVVSVDVTEPDGSPEWSLCFDRNVLGKVVDYMMFMAYDQTGSFSTSPGTTAGFNWVNVNVNKFLGQEEVSKEKLILGIPFYTRLWKEKDGKVTSTVVSMKNIDSQIPSNASKEWDENLKQYYTQFEKDGAVYKMWIEDERSIKEKLSLIKEKDLQGVCFWVKDFEKDSVWNIVKESLE